jgi:hypothetical protein
MSLLSLLAILILGALVALFVQTHRVEGRPEQEAFAAGRVPSPALDGLLKGSVPGMAAAPTGWKGKILDAASATGRNLFEKDGKTVEKYPFRTFATKGLRDPKLDVLRIDYDMAGNPWWLRRIVDEIVQVSPGKYLGKVHLQVLPGIPFTVAYFRLEKT